jgi:hypothetical protein
MMFWMSRSLALSSESFMPTWKFKNQTAHWVVDWAVLRSTATRTCTLLLSPREKKVRVPGTCQRAFSR